MHDFRGENDCELLVRLHTISGNRPHPEAAVGQLSVPISSGNYESAFIQIADDVIAMFFWMHDPALVIWNWRTGKVIVVGCEVCSYLTRSANPLKPELRRVWSPQRRIRLRVPLQPCLHGHHDRRVGRNRDIHVQRRRRRVVTSAASHAGRPATAAARQAGPGPDPVLHTLGTIRDTAYAWTPV